MKRHAKRAELDRWTKRKQAQTAERVRQVVADAPDDVLLAILTVASMELIDDFTVFYCPFCDREVDVAKHPNAAIRHKVDCALGTVRAAFSALLDARPEDVDAALVNLRSDDTPQE